MYNMIDVSVAVAVNYNSSVMMGIVWGVNNSCCLGRCHMFLYTFLQYISKYVFNVLLCKQMHGITYRHYGSRKIVSCQSEDAVL